MPRSQDRSERKAVPDDSGSRNLTRPFEFKQQGRYRYLRPSSLRHRSVLVFVPTRAPGNFVFSNAEPFAFAAENLGESLLYSHAIGDATSTSRGSGGCGIEAHLTLEVQALERSDVGPIGWDFKARGAGRRLLRASPWHWVRLDAGESTHVTMVETFLFNLITRYPAV